MKTSQYPNFLSPYRIAWVITNGRDKKHFLWISVRKTGIYVASGMPGGFHTSYHKDGRFQWRAKKVSLDQRFEDRPPLHLLKEPILIQNATSAISDEILSSFELSEFNENEPANEIIYIDNRVMSQSISYNVWAVPPNLHHKVFLFPDSPVQFYMTNHTVPWIVVAIYG